MIPAHLKGDLQLYSNSNAVDPNNKALADPMMVVPKGSYGVNVFSDGTVEYQQKAHGKPVGGMPPTKVSATCVGGLLLTWTTQDNEVFALGVRRDPATTKPM